VGLLVRAPRSCSAAGQGGMFSTQPAPNYGQAVPALHTAYIFPGPSELQPCMHTIVLMDSVIELALGMVVVTLRSAQSWDLWHGGCAVGMDF
jgi:hypothetical protein